LDEAYTKADYTDEKTGDADIDKRIKDVREV